MNWCTAETYFLPDGKLCAIVKEGNRLRGGPHTCKDFEEALRWFESQGVIQRIEVGSEIENPISPDFESLFPWK